MSRRSKRIAKREHARKKAKRFPKPNKRLAAAFRVAVDPYRKIEYNVYGQPYHGNQKYTGSIGYMCPSCNMTSQGWHFWINPSLAVCSDCAFKLLESRGGEPK